MNYQKEHFFFGGGVSYTYHDHVHKYELKNRVLNILYWVFKKSVFYILMYVKQNKNTFSYVNSYSCTSKVLKADIALDCNIGLY